MASSSAAAAMASADASQLGGTSDASQLEGSSETRIVSRFRIGSFNVGVDQNLLAGKRCNKTLKKVEDLIATCVQDSALDIMNLSEFGSHRQGLHACRPPIHADDMEIFQTYPHPFVRVNNNYLTAWAFDADTSQFGVQSVTDIAPHAGGIVRTVLDHVVPTKADDDDPESMD